MGKDLRRLSGKKLIAYRCFTVGFLWQNPGHNLIPYLTARENVEVPLLLSGRQDKKRALELLELMGVGRQLNKCLIPEAKLQLGPTDTVF